MFQINGEYIVVNTKLNKITSKELRKAHPFSNPLVDITKIRMAKKRVTVGTMSQDITDANTGEIYNVGGVAKVIEVDQRSFVQIFKQGVKEMYELSKSAFRVFNLVLDHYEKQSFDKRQQWNDEVMLYVERSKKSINNEPLDMAYSTYQRGIAELLAKRFISVKTPNNYWINPQLFFIGDKVNFLKQYRVTKNIQIKEI